MASKQTIFIGDVFTTNNYGDCVVIEYNSFFDITVRFGTGYTTKTYACILRRGEVKDPLFRVVCGVGCVGIGDRSASNNNTDYNIWEGMLRRCYIEKDKHYHVYGGDGVTVCEEWYNFQVFSKWCDNNYKNGMQLDKDILVQGNKIYSPETCVFIPQYLNVLLSRKGRSSPTATGVYKRRGRYETACRVKGVTIALGTFPTEMQAFAAYKAAKEKIIQTAAQEYYDAKLIGEDVYTSLMNWDVQP